MTMNTTLVINAKGGVGKSTITTNLASYFAARDIRDDDRRLRSSRLESELAGTAQQRTRARFAAPTSPAASVAGSRSGRRAIPRETRQLIIDALAGPCACCCRISGAHAVDSDPGRAVVDRRACDREFHQELLLVGRVRFRNHSRFAVVANRVRNSKRSTRRSSASCPR